MHYRILQQSVFIAAPTATVWEAINDVSCWNTWHPAVQRVELLETPKAGAIGRIHTGRGTTYQFKITRVAANSLLEWQREYELGTSLVQSYTVTKNAEGSILTTGLSCDGNFAKIVVGIMRNRFTRDLEKQMADLKAFCEKQCTEERKAVGQDQVPNESRLAPPSHDSGA